MPTSPPAQAIIPPPDPALTHAAETLVLRDVKPPVPIVNPWPYAVAALLLALLVAAFLTWLLRKRRGQRGAPPTLVLVPPHRRASDALHAALALIRDPRAFITQVANTLRLYLEERFQLHAPERTTEEFLQELPTCPALSSRQTELLADFLIRSDLVKFARHEPAETELRALWHTAHRLVIETSPSVDGSPGTKDPGGQPKAETQMPKAPKPLTLERQTTETGPLAPRD